MTGIDQLPRRIFQWMQLARKCVRTLTDAELGSIWILRAAVVELFTDEVQSETADW